MSFFRVFNKGLYSLGVIYMWLTYKLAPVIDLFIGSTMELLIQFMNSPFLYTLLSWAMELYGLILPRYVGILRSHNKDPLWLNNQYFMDSKNVSLSSSTISTTLRLKNTIKTLVTNNPPTVFRSGFSFSHPNHRARCFCRAAGWMTSIS